MTFSDSNVVGAGQQQAPVSIRECGIRRSVSKRVGTRTALDTAPQTLLARRAPARAHRRLDFEAGEFVALEFRSDRHEHAARDADLVLREHVEAVGGALARLEEEARAVAEIVAVVTAIAGAEDDVVAAERPVMLRVEVDGVERCRDTGWERAGRCDRNTPGRWWRDSPPRRVQRPSRLPPDRFASAVLDSPVVPVYMSPCSIELRCGATDPIRCGSPPGRSRSRRARRRRSPADASPRSGLSRTRDTRRRCRGGRHAAPCTGPSTLDPTDTLTSVPFVSVARLVITLMTPLTALAPQTLPPGPRVTSMRSMSGIDDVLRFPEHAGEDGGVDGASVDQDEHLVGGADGEAARGDAVLRAGDLRDVQVPGEAQRLRPGSSRPCGAGPRR